LHHGHHRHPLKPAAIAPPPLSCQRNCATTVSSGSRRQPLCLTSHHCICTMREPPDQICVSHYSFINITHLRILHCAEPPWMELRSHSSRTMDSLCITLESPPRQTTIWMQTTCNAFHHTGALLSRSWTNLHRCKKRVTHTCCSLTPKPPPASLPCQKTSSEKKEQPSLHLAPAAATRIRAANLVKDWSNERGLTANIDIFGCLCKIGLQDWKWLIEKINTNIIWW